MKSLSAQRVNCFAGCGIGFCTLSCFQGDFSLRDVAVAANTRAPSFQGAAFVPAYPDCPARRAILTALPLASDVPYCIYRIVAGDTLSSIARKYRTTPDAIMRANQETHVPGQKKVTDSNFIRAGAVLLIPNPSFSQSSLAPEGTSFPHLTITPEAIVPSPVSEEPAGSSNAQALPFSTDEEIVHMIEALQDDQKALQTDPQKVDLACVSTFTLAIVGVVLFRVWISRSPKPVPPWALNGHAIPPVAPPDEPVGNSALTDVQIATHYLSTPKHEDVIVSASTPSLYALVLADGASSYRVSGGEISGGGRQAAEIAAHTALTYLLSHILPSLGMQEIMVHLHECFSAANTTLEEHNASTCIPGGTTLIIALLCQGEDGIWYWVYGNLGNGVLALLHSQPLLDGWPIHTPLLTKQSNGGTTLALPGYATQGYRHSIGCKPHVPGDILVMGSDGLEHLDTVTKNCDRLYFTNYLWKQMHNKRSRLDMVLHSLQNGRAEPQWSNALTLDDTTIGILWA